MLINELDQVPEYYLDEVLDFVKYLKTKYLHECIETALMSESSLKKDWLCPEDYEAWRNL